MIDTSVGAEAFRAAARDQLLKESANDDWAAGLIKGKRGGILSVVGNIVHVLEHHPAWFGVLHFDESSFDTWAKAQPPFETPRKAPFVWSDEDDTIAAAWFQREAGIMAAKRSWRKPSRPLPVRMDFTRSATT